MILYKKIMWKEIEKSDKKIYSHLFKPTYTWLPKRYYETKEIPKNVN